MPHPGRVQGWAHRSRVCLYDLGHVPCHLSAVWGYHQPCQVLGDRKALCWSSVWSDIGLGLACWSFTSHSAGGWSKMHFCLVQLQEELCCGSPRQGWGSISISAAAGGFPEVGALPSPWPALPREPSTCLPTELCVEGMCRWMNKMIAIKVCVGRIMALHLWVL